MTSKLNKIKALTVRTIPIIIIALSIVLLNCSVPREDIFIGEPPTLTATSFHVPQLSQGSSEADPAVITMWESESAQAIIVDVEAAKIMASYPTPIDFKAQGIVNSGSYIIAYNSTTVLSISQQGIVSEVNIELFSSIKGHLFNYDNHTLLLQDGFRHLALLQFNADGSLHDFWTGGPLIGDMAIFSTGTLLKGGQLVTFDTENRFHILNVEASIQEQRYVIDSFTLEDVVGVTWLAPGAGDSQILVSTHAKHNAGGNVSFGIDGNTQGVGGSLYVIDIASQEIVTSIELPKTHLVIANSASSPHLIFAHSAHSHLHTVYYSETPGTLRQDAVIYEPGQPVTQSFFDVKTKTLFLVQPSPGGRKANTKQKITRIRSLDGRILSLDSVLNGAKITLTPSHIIRQYDAVLGKISMRHYGDNATWQTLRGYNLDRLLQARRQQ